MRIIGSQGDLPFVSVIYLSVGRHSIEPHHLPSLTFTFFVIPKSRMLLRRFRLANFGVDVEVALDGGIKEEGWDWDSTGVP